MMKRNISIIVLLIVAAIFLEGMSNLAEERALVHYDPSSSQDTTLTRFDDIVIALDERLYGIEEADSINHDLQSRLADEQKINSALKKDFKSVEAQVETIFVEPTVVFAEERIVLEDFSERINEDSLKSRIFELEEKLERLEIEKSGLQTRVDSLEIKDSSKRGGLFRRKN